MFGQPERFKECFLSCVPSVVLLWTIHPDNHFTFRSLLLISGPCTTLSVLQYKHPTEHKTKGSVRPPSSHVKVTRRPAIITRLGLFCEGWRLPACKGNHGLQHSNIQNNPAVPPRLWGPHTTCCRLDACRLLCNPPWTLIKNTVDIISATMQRRGRNKITTFTTPYSWTRRPLLALAPAMIWFFSFLQKVFALSRDDKGFCKGICVFTP